MRVSATQRAFDLTVGGVFLALVFVVVIVLHGALTGALRSIGLPGLPAEFASGVIVFGTVVGGFALVTGYIALMRARAENTRLRMRLPEGPCCVLWSEANETAAAQPEAGASPTPPFVLRKPLDVRFPPLARRFAIEGVAVAEFEIGVDGRAREIRCIDAWPSTIFFTAAKSALERARFATEPHVSPSTPPRLRMPFVFRIRTARSSGANRIG